MNIITKNGHDFNFDLVYYIAGPMTGIPKYNFPAFDAALEVLGNEGIKCVSPHTIDHGETDENRGQLPYQVYLRAGFKLLLECDGIILLRGWMNSKGTRHELHIARALQFPVYTLGEGFLMELSENEH
jgi:hypothetical protein